MAQQNMAQVGRDVTAMSVDEAIEAAQLHPRAVEELQARADAHFQMAQARLENWARMGITQSLTEQEQSIEALRRHYLYCAALGALNHTNVDAANYIGKTTEEIAQAIVAKAGARRRGKGARAVAAKYGDEAAWRITGHKVRH